MKSGTIQGAVLAELLLLTMTNWRFLRCPIGVFYFVVDDEELSLLLLNGIVNVHNPTPSFCINKTNLDWGCWKRWCCEMREQNWTKSK